MEAVHLRLIDSASDLRKEAMERAGRMLALRPRTEREIRDRLTEADFPDDVVEDTVGRLYELELLNDEDFALDWIEQRTIRKGLGPKALIAELNRKGIDRATAEAALARSGVDEQATATAEAGKLLHKVIRYPIRDQAAKLHQMLMRRGFSWDATEAAVKAVLPPEGWD
ncbi:MAG: recombination regulator RecX [Actinobacteria bacterium]|nr:recombination regulator RecX [Actinomycetota bacterium]